MAAVQGVPKYDGPLDFHVKIKCIRCCVQLRSENSEHENDRARRVPATVLGINKDTYMKA